MVELYSRGFALVHKTFSFVAGAVIVGFGGLYMHDQIRFAVSALKGMVMSRRIGSATELFEQVQVLKRLGYAIFAILLTNVAYCIRRGSRLL